MMLLQKTMGVKVDRSVRDRSNAYHQLLDGRGAQTQEQGLVEFCEELKGLHRWFSSDSRSTKLERALRAANYGGSYHFKTVNHAERTEK
jgi:hypothetical protein